MRATIREVAREAGVSPSTVSRALSMPEMVNPTTRERVLRAAQRLGYAPNRAARGLITGRTGNIGLIVPDLANPFFPSVVKGVQARAREADYAVFLADTDEDPTAEVGLIRVLGKQVDGLILCSPRPGRKRSATCARAPPWSWSTAASAAFRPSSSTTWTACGRRSLISRRSATDGSPG
ncbi:LacI family DNA-binding transcriptional regulator [Micromonospora sp. ATA51]|uniref:LacI family DNA-binding transcriptional regulator n=1 Tax=Micromonospora sp. ATA51 TaxID=2806098 RepID=UPI002814F651|nr:LacI family DNA-binding transcriptional regulator [Micromonospora sp. ATA51]